VAWRALLLRVLRDRGLDVVGEVAPCPPGGVPRGLLVDGPVSLCRRAVLILELLDRCVWRGVSRSLSSLGCPGRGAQHSRCTPLNKGTEASHECEVRACCAARRRYSVE
jgi:hypothetical protein